MKTNEKVIAASFIISAAVAGAFAGKAVISANTANKTAIHDDKLASIEESQGNFQRADDYLRLSAVETNERDTNALLALGEFAVGGSLSFMSNRLIEAASSTSIEVSRPRQPKPLTPTV